MSLLSADLASLLWFAGLIALVLWFARQPLGWSRLGMRRPKEWWWPLLGVWFIGPLLLGVGLIPPIAIGFGVYLALGTPPLQSFSEVGEALGLAASLLGLVTLLPAEFVFRGIVFVGLAHIGFRRAAAVSALVATSAAGLSAIGPLGEYVSDLLGWHAALGALILISGFVGYAFIQGVSAWAFRRADSILPVLIATFVQVVLGVLGSQVIT